MFLTTFTVNFVTPLLSTFATVALAVSATPQAEARTVTGPLAGFSGVTAVDRVDVDTLYVPLPSGDGVVHVRCSTGDFTWNYLVNRRAAHELAKAWCF